MPGPGRITSLKNLEKAREAMKKKGWTGTGPKTLEGRLRAGAVRFKTGKYSKLLKDMFPCDLCSIRTWCKYYEKGGVCQWKVKRYQELAEEWKDLTATDRLNKLCLDTQVLIDFLRVKHQDKMNYTLVKAIEVLGNHLDKIQKQVEGEKFNIEGQVTLEIDKIREKVSEDLQKKLQRKKELTNERR